MTERLNITIIGGGLAGAFTARVLRERHNVTILERTTDPIEVGAAINVGPNGVRILAKYGFDREKVGSIPVRRIKNWNKDGKMLLENQINAKEEYGEDWLFQHRADLRAEFLRLATAPSQDLRLNGEPARIRYGANVVDVDVEEGIAFLDTGEKIKSDLVIAADGVKSIVRPLVVGDEAFKTARPSGFSAFRFTLPRSIVTEKYPDFEILNRSQGATLGIILAFDLSRRSVVLYPCRNYELLNFVCIIPDTSLKAATTESWTAPGDVEELLACFTDYPEWVIGVLKLAKDIKLWQLRDQDPLPSYIKGRTVLIGDAAHAMTPHQGQGGTQAVEDAEGFELFNQSCSGSDIPGLLKDFDMVRRKRAGQIQDNTRKAQDKKTAEEVHMFAKYNWTYPGIIEGVRRMKSGAELIQF